MKLSQKNFSEYNSIVKEYNKIYRDAIKTLGLNDSSFWILYTLWGNSEGITEKEIIERNFLPPQTINTELKKLERSGFVKLVNEANKRTKKVYLTTEGIKLSRHTVDRIMDLEEHAMNFLSEQEQLEFLRIFS